MGFYINPPESTKEDWLREHGEPLRGPKWPPAPGKGIACLVLNPGFSAAAIVFDEQEFNEFSDAQDPRLKLWYQVAADDLLAVCPEVEEKLTRA